MPHSGTIINFPGQESDEHIFIFTRRHPAAFIPVLGFLVLMVFSGGGILFILGNIGLLSNNTQVFLISSFLLVMLLVSLFEFFDFYFDLDIVTDRRVVDIDQKRLFNRSVSELLFEDIQDAEASTTGILGTLFSFGDVIIQTAGTKSNFHFSQIAMPEKVAAMILDLSDQQDRGVPVAERHPEGPIAAIINGKMYPHTPDHEDEII